MSIWTEGLVGAVVLAIQFAMALGGLDTWHLHRRLALPLDGTQSGTQGYAILPLIADRTLTCLVSSSFGNCFQTHFFKGEHGVDI